MKTSRILKLIFILIISISSCNNNDNEINQTHELVGRWQTAWKLNDSGNSGNYELIFLSDNYGSWSSIVYYSDGTALGVAEGFTWSTTNNPKTLIIPELKLNTAYSINSDEQLILNNFKRGQPFTRIE